MKKNKENATRWLRDAENTLRQAAHILEGGQAHNVVCFLAEQACQKALKAVSYYQGKRFVTIHSIAELIKQVSETYPEFLKLRDKAVRLDQYYLSSRYPDAIAEPAIPSEVFVKDQAEEAVNIAKKIFEVCKRIVRD